MNNPYQKYQMNSVMTASPAELTLMLYNGAIKYCNLAADAMEKKNRQESNKNLKKVQAIIGELRITLNHKYKVANDWDKLYLYIHQLLVEANIRQDRVKLEEALGLIRDFKELWLQIMKVNKTGSL